MDQWEATTRERAQTTQDTSFGHQVWFFIFQVFFLYLTMFIVTICIFKRSNGPVAGYDEGTSPNNARHVVWAPGV